MMRKDTIICNRYPGREDSNFEHDTLWIMRTPNKMGQFDYRYFICRRGKTSWAWIELQEIPNNETEEIK